MTRLILLLLAALSTAAGASTPLPTPCPVAINACSWGLGQPGDILVTSPGSYGYVLGLNSQTGTWYIFGQLSTGWIDGIVVDAQDPSKVMVMQEGAGGVERLDGNGTNLGLYGTSASTKSKMGAFNPIDGSLWVPMQDPSRIYRFPAGGGPAVQIVTSGAPLYYPSGMAFDHSGNLYITNAGLDQVLKIANSELSQPNPLATVLSSGVANALGIVFDGDHTLYSAGWFPSSPTNSSQIWRTDTVTGAASLVTQTFAPLAENAGGPLYQCDGITMDLQGHLWVMMFMNPGPRMGLLELDTNGTCLAWYEMPTSIGATSLVGSTLDAVAVMGFSFPRPGSCPANIDLNCPSPTPTPTATPSPVPVATPCSNYCDGLYGFNEYNLALQTGQDWGPGFGVGTWLGGGAPAFIPEGSNNALSGFAPRVSHTAAALSFDPASFDFHDTMACIWFQVHDSAPASEQVLLEARKGSYYLRVSAFGQGHAHFNQLQVTYSTASGLVTAYVPMVYGTGPANEDDLYTWQTVSLGRQSLAVILQASGLTIYPYMPWPGTVVGPNIPVAFSDLGPATLAASPDFLVFGSDQGLLHPLEGYLDDFRIYRCSSTAFTPTPTATVSAATTPTPAATAVNPRGGKVLVIPNNRMLGKSQQSFNLKCPVSGMTRLKLLDSSGRVLIELLAESMQEGQHKVLTWDGKDSSGNLLPSGVYTAVVVAADGHIYRQNFMIIR